MKNNFEMSNFINHLEYTNQVIVTTDETNGFRSVTTKKYMTVLD